MRSEPSRRRASDRNPVPVVVLGTAALLIVGCELLAAPAGGTATASGAGRAWLFALVLAAVLGAMGAGDPQPGVRRRSRRAWLAGVGLFTLTLGLPALVDLAARKEAALAVALAAAFLLLLLASLGGLAALSLAERHRAARDERARREKRAPLLARSGRGGAGSEVRPRRRASRGRSPAGGRPGSRRGRP